MYEAFGAVVEEHTVELRLFLPDASQYEPGRGGPPRIRSIVAPGDHQALANQAPWDVGTAPPLTPQPHPGGTLYVLRLDAVPDGFYQYKYLVTFENGSRRWCGDPCTRWLGTDAENAAFVVGGATTTVSSLAGRLPLGDLVIYELMIDDFTAAYRGNRAPVDAVVDRLDHLVDLGVNAVEFMPWMAWRGRGFSWGYNAHSFFAAEDGYVADPADPLDRLVRLKRLVTACHERGLHVLVDGVFNHVDAGTTPDTGFPYHWLYQDPEESPYTGSYARGGYFEDLDYRNQCTQQYITDACIYWLDAYALDGIRLDYTLGFHDPNRLDTGLGKLVADLRQHVSADGRENVSIVLEHLSDNRYEAIDLVNTIDATGCWYDRFLYDVGDYAAQEGIDTRAMRVLDTARDFRAGASPVPYLENHDHTTMTNRVGGRARWWAIQPAAIALLTCSGGPLLRNGAEFGDDQHLPWDGPGRVVPRTLDWDLAEDGIGRRLRDLYRRLIGIRAAHPALRGPNFHPRFYDEQWNHFDRDGFGVDTSRGLAVYHRWGEDDEGRLERFIVALNFSASDHTVNLPFSVDGRWEDLLSGTVVEVRDTVLRGHQIPSHWGRLYWRVDP
jgi:1,4-alpha-glucan branching enzyme